MEDLPIIPIKSIYFLNKQACLTVLYTVARPTYF